MSKYILTFSKMGTICYTSHLDMMKMFKRTFRRAGIKQSYSKGFNPHPKMGFAQPLSLGYWGMNELLEFETDEEYTAEHIEKSLYRLMPEGVTITKCELVEPGKKTLAARTIAAEYIIAIPLHGEAGLTNEGIKKAYMGQTRILTYKKQKKKSELVEVDIKEKIRMIDFVVEKEALFVTTILDSGSISNLSPELVIQTLIDCIGIATERSEVQVMRRQIIFE